MKPAKENELKCVLCKRKAEIREYTYSEDFKKEGVCLCQYHYGNYMAHGIKKLDEIMEKLRKPSGVRR